jgi:hypothetical protein
MFDEPGVEQLIGFNKMSYRAPSCGDLLLKAFYTGDEGLMFASVILVGGIPTTLLQGLLVAEVPLNVPVEKTQQALQLLLPPPLLARRQQPGELLH